MTDEQARALGERWVKAGGSWMPGMLTLEGYRLIHRVEFAIINEAAIGDWMFAADGKRWHDNLDEHVPDLRDPATRGAALEVVLSRLALHPHDPVIADVIANLWLDPERLVAALEAAP